MREGSRLWGGSKFWRGSRLWEGSRFWGVFQAPAEQLLEFSMVWPAVMEGSFSPKQCIQQGEGGAGNQGDVSRSREEGGPPHCFLPPLPSYQCVRERISRREDGLVEMTEAMGRAGLEPLRPDFWAQQPGYSWQKTPLLSELTRTRTRQAFQEPGGTQALSDTMYSGYGGTDMWRSTTPSDQCWELFIEVFGSDWYGGLVVRLGRWLCGQKSSLVVRPVQWVSGQHCCLTVTTFLVWIPSGVSLCRSRYSRNISVRLTGDCELCGPVVDCWPVKDL